MQLQRSIPGQVLHRCTGELPHLSLSFSCSRANHFIKVGEAEKTNRETHQLQVQLFFFPFFKVLNAAPTQLNAKLVGKLSSVHSE